MGSGAGAAVGARPGPSQLGHPEQSPGHMLAGAPQEQLLEWAGAAGGRWPGKSWVVVTVLWLVLGGCLSLSLWDLRCSCVVLSGRTAVFP